MQTNLINHIPLRTSHRCCHFVVHKSLSLLSQVAELLASANAAGVRLAAPLDRFYVPPPPADPTASGRLSNSSVASKGGASSAGSPESGLGSVGTAAGASTSHTRATPTPTPTSVHRTTNLPVGDGGGHSRSHSGSDSFVSASRSSLAGSGSVGSGAGWAASGIGSGSQPASARGSIHGTVIGVGPVISSEQSDSTSAQVSLDGQFSTLIQDSNSVASAVGGGGCAGAVFKAIRATSTGQQPQRLLALSRQMQAPPPPPPLRQSSAQNPQIAVLMRQQPSTPPQGPRHSHSNASLGTASSSSFQI